MGCTVSVADKKMQGRNMSKKVDQQPKKPDTAQKKATDQNNTYSEDIELDQRLPLTARQKFSIMKSWKGIARNMQETGTLMFIRLFETNEETRSMFKKLVKGGQYDIAQLRESKELENHVRQVMYTLDEAISTMDDVDGVIQLLHAVGKSHVRLRTKGFNPNIFWKIEEPFLRAVRDTLGDRYTANMEHIYKKAIKFILETLKEGFGSGSPDDVILVE